MIDDSRKAKMRVEKTDEIRDYLEKTMLELPKKTKRHHRYYMAGLIEGLAYQHLTNEERDQLYLEYAM